MSKLIDPIQVLASNLKKVAHPELVRAAIDEVPFEIPLAPAPGTKVVNLTVGSTYRTPIPVLFDPISRTTFPLPNDR